MGFRNRRDRDSGTKQPRVSSQRRKSPLSPLVKGVGDLLAFSLAPYAFRLELEDIGVNLVMIPPPGFFSSCGPSGGGSPGPGADVACCSAVAGSASTSPARPVCRRAFAGRAAALRVPGPASPVPSASPHRSSPPRLRDRRRNDARARRTRTSLPPRACRGCRR